MSVAAVTGRASAGQALAYALGSVGTGVFTTVPSVLLLFYCTEVAGVAPAAAGAIILIPKLWSLAWDPLVGVWSDRVRTPWGRRAPFLLAGALGVSGAFAALFAAPLAGASAATLWIGCAYFLLSSVYSIYAVPYVAVPAEAAGDGEASRLIAWRMALVMVGVILGAAGAPMMVEAFGGGLTGYRTMGLVIGAGCLFLMLAPLLVVGRGPAGPRPGSPLAWRGALRGPYLWLALAYVLQMAGVAVVSAVMPYLVTRVLGRETGDVGIAMAVILVTTMLAVPAWARLGARRGEARALRLAALLYGAAALLPTAVLLLAPGWPPFLASLVLLGAGFAGLQVLPFVLCARVIGQAGRSAEGALTGVWTAAEKVGLALGPSLTALALAVLRPSDHGALIVFAGLAPALLALVSLAPLRVSRVAP